MLCPDCKGPMKPLFTGFFCPKDCDRPAAKSKTTVLPVGGTKTYTFNSPAWGWGAWGAGSGTKYTPATGQCPDAMCRAMGKQTHDTYQSNASGVTTAQRHYHCYTCSKSFKEDLDVSTHPIPGIVP